MKGLLVHGCYDQATFRTLESLGVESFGFDLRARSANLVTFRELKELLNLSRSEKAVLVFANDSKETILSFLDLLKNTNKSFLIEYRDTRDVSFYESIGRSFIWYFDPAGDWKKIISSPLCEGIILPLRYQALYHDMPHLWTLIEDRRISIWLHADNFTEATFFEGKEDIHASLDLSSVSRTVDQVSLKSQKFWRKINESAAGQ